MSDNTNIAISYGGYQPANLSALDAIFMARGGRQLGTGGGGGGGDIPALVTAMRVGMNSAGAGASGTEFFMRDLSRHGRYIVQGGASNGQDLDPSLIDFDTYFPISLPSGATGVILAITDGAWLGPMGTYTWTIDNRFTVTSSAAKDSPAVTDTDIVFTGSAGSGTIAIGGIPRKSGWSLTITGPFSSLTAAQRGLKILPQGDANPERLYSDALRAALVATGARQWRPMEDIRANYPDSIPYLLNRGGKTGLPSCTLEACVQLCNDLNMDLQWNFNLGAPAEYIPAVCNYVAPNLKKGLAFLPEPGNELFNESFALANYMRHQAWLAGYAASGGARTACVGWTTTGYIPTAGFGWQPFEPNYTTDGGATYQGRLTQAVSTGDYIFGNIFGFGQQIFRAAANAASGTIFPGAGNATIVRMSDGTTLDTAKNRMFADRALALDNAAKAPWAGAGNDPLKCRIVIGVQSGNVLGVEKQVLDANINALWARPFSVQQAPYFSKYQFNEDVGTGTIASILDTVFTGEKADIELKQHWVRDRRLAIQAAAPSGVTPAANCHEIYEFFHHEQFGGAQGAVAFKAFRRDGRLGSLLKYAMTLHAVDNPAAVLQIFNVVTGEPDDARSGWGVYFYADEARSSTPTNPAGIALKEWFDASAAGKPSLDIFCNKSPAAGTQTVTILRGPQLTGSINGVLRATGGASFDVPFTLASGSPAVNVTYTAVAGQSLTFNIVPQASLFSVGANSVNLAVTTATAALPKLANKMVDFDPSTMAQQADGTAFSRSLVDTVSGVTFSQPTAGAQPTWVANAVGGKPGIRGNGSSQWLFCNSPGAMKTVIDSRNWTLIDVMINTGPTGNGSIGGAGDGSGFFPVCDGTYVGHFNGNSTRTQVPHPATAFTVAGITTSTADHGGQAFAGLQKIFVNGMRITAKEGYPSSSASAGTDYGLLALNAAGQLKANTTLVRRILFNVELSAAEVAQWTKALYDFYGVTHPTAGMSAVYGGDGDSLSNGETAPVAASPMYLIAQANGWPMGTWFNAAVGGRTSQECIDYAANEVDGVFATWGKRPVLFFQERANDVNSTNLTPAQTGAKHTTYIAARKAANSTIKVIGQTPADWTNAFIGTSPDAWNTYLIANSVSIGYSALARVDQNAVVGSNSGAWNTYPESGPWSSPWSDGAHYVTYINQANVIAPLMAAA